MASPPTLSSTWASQVADGDTLGDEHDEANFGGSNETPNLSAHPSQGEFTVTHVTARAAVLRKDCRWP
jgi:hypothetical protein